MMDDQAAPDDAAAPESDGYSITIACGSDGTFTVSMSESGAESPDDAQDQPATAESFDDALKIAKEMYSAESGEETAEPDDGTDGNEPMSPDDAKSAWKQMASKKSQGPM